MQQNKVYTRWSSGYPLVCEWPVSVPPLLVGRSCWCSLVVVSLANEDPHVGGIVPVMMNVARSHPGVQ